MVKNYKEVSIYKESFDDMIKRLLEAKENNELVYTTFNGHTFYSDKITNPGVGKYNLTKNFELTGWDTKFGGFDDRFKKYVDQVPGVGDYNPEENKNFGKNRNNIRYKSLYKQTNLTQQILGFNGFKDQEGPTCTTYTPLYQDEVMKIKKLYLIS